MHDVFLYKNTKYLTKNSRHKIKRLLHIITLPEISKHINVKHTKM